MHILITGATGLIGSQLIPYLSRYHQVTALSRNVSTAARILSHDVKLLSDINTLSSLDEFDLVINLAGEPIAGKRWSKAQKHRICQSRWELTEKLVSLFNASSQPPSLFISGSAIGFYGRQGSHEIDERFTAIHPEFTHKVCQPWEDKALSVQSDRTRVCVLRTGIVLASHGGALAKMLPPFRLGLGGQIGSGNQYMSWIHIADMLHGIVHLIDTPECQGIYNFTAPNPVTNRAFSHSLATQLNRPCLLPVPAAMLKLLMGEMADLVLYGQRVIPQRLLESGYKFHYPYLPTALAGLNL